MNLLALLETEGVGGGIAARVAGDDRFVDFVANVAERVVAVDEALEAVVENGQCGNDSLFVCRNMSDNLLD